jgi:post-segregation antitoxin (ccd killing protein)
MNDPATQPQSQRSSEKVELSIHIDSDLLDQIQHLTNDPSRVIETAIKQWLRGERSPDADLARGFRRNPPVPPRGEWND